MLEARGPGQERCLLTSSVLSGQQYLGQCGCPFHGCTVSLLSSCSLPYRKLRKYLSPLLSREDDYICSCFETRRILVECQYKVEMGALLFYFPQVLCHLKSGAFGGHCDWL